MKKKKRQNHGQKTKTKEKINKSLQHLTKNIKLAIFDALLFLGKRTITRETHKWNLQTLPVIYLVI